MIKFDGRNFHKNKICGYYISYIEMERMTADLVKDYDATLFTNPKAIDAEDFLLNYLNATEVDYQHIYPDEDGIILGCTIFDESLLPVYNKDQSKKEYIHYDPRSVIIDRSLVEGNRIIQNSITTLHEGGHLWLHESIYAGSKDQLMINNQNGYIACHRMETSDDAYNQYPDAEKWLERQATWFAVTLALPNESLQIETIDLFRKNGIKEDTLIYDTTENNELAKNIIPAELSKIYKMSKEAIYYRLQKTELYTTEEEYNAKRAQISFFDMNIL